MRLKTKLQAIAFLPLLVFAAAIVSQYWAHRQSESLYRHRVAVAEFSRTVMNLVSLTYEYGLTHGERAASQWRGQYTRAEQLLSELPGIAGLPAADPQIDGLRQGLQQAGRLFAELLAGDNQGGAEALGVQVRMLRNNLVNRLILELQSMTPAIDSMHDAIDEFRERSFHYGTLLIIGVLLTLALALLILAFWVISGIYRSLALLQRGMEKVASGDLESRVRLASRDELEELGRGFDEMTGKLSLVTVSRDALYEEMAERRLAEESLLASESQLREAQRIAQLGSWELDLVTNTLQWSEETFRIFERDPHAFPASYEAFLETIHPEDRELVSQAYANSLKTRTPYAVEHRLLLADGRIKFVHERCETHFDRQGRPLRSIGTVQDISAQRRIEAELQRLNDELELRVAARTRDLEAKSREVETIQQALMNIVEDLNHKSLALADANLKMQEVDRLKSMFIASMSHELRTPLNSIIGFSSIVLGEWLGPLNPEQREKLAIVLRTGKHLLSLINDLIDISKIEAGKLESVVEEFELFDLIGEAVGLVEAEIRAKDIVLRVEAIHLTMATDRRRLYQCLVNFLGNAAKFTRQGTITLAATLAEAGASGQERVTIAIRDTGIGIREEDLPKLFASFVRLTLPEDMQVKGTGLGLYLVKKIVTEILGGEVGVKSAPGQGSEFSLTVPVRLAVGERDT